MDIHEYLLGKYQGETGLSAYKYILGPEKLKAKEYAELLPETETMIFGIKRLLRIHIFTNQAFYYTDKKYHKHRMAFSQWKPIVMNKENGTINIDNNIIDLNHAISKKEEAFFEDLETFFGELFQYILASYDVSKEENPEPLSGDANKIHRDTKKEKIYQISSGTSLMQGTFAQAAKSALETRAKDQVKSQNIASNITKAIGNAVLAAVLFVAFRYFSGASMSGILWGICLLGAIVFAGIAIKNLFSFIGAAFSGSRQIECPICHTNANVFQNVSQYNCFNCGAFIDLSVKTENITKETCAYCAEDMIYNPEMTHNVCYHCNVEYDQNTIMTNENYKKCPVCDSPVPKDSKYCKNCITYLEGGIPGIIELKNLSVAGKLAAAKKWPQMIRVKLKTANTIDALQLLLMELTRCVQFMEYLVDNDSKEEHADALIHIVQSDLNDLFKSILIKMKAVLERSADHYQKKFENRISKANYDLWQSEVNGLYVLKDEPFIIVQNRLVALMKQKGLGEGLKPWPHGLLVIEEIAASSAVGISNQQWMKIVNYQGIDLALKTMEV